jgi:penicillin amidase
MRRLLVVAVATVLIGVSVPASGAQGTGRVTIYRDDYGVPHLYAGKVDALFYGMGYVAADDRLWQAEILRRAATGNLAQLLGPDALAGDVQARLLFGPESRRVETFSSSSEYLQQIISSYVAGVNARIEDEKAAGGLPPEFGAFGLTPQPWSVEDSVAVFMLLGSQFGWFGADELANFATWQQLQTRFGADALTVFGDLFWLDDPDAPTTVPAIGAIGRPGRRSDGPRSELPASAAVAAKGFAAQSAAADEAWRMAGIPEEGWASNAMVVAPRLSADRRALLLGGPQMGYSTPQINHEVGLHGAGFDVTGMTIAGIPFVPIGVGDGYAWTLTSGGADNTDIYVESLNPSDPSQYLFNEQWLSLECRNEQFGIAGSPAPHTETLCASVHGPVIGVQDNLAFSLKNVTVGKELESLEAWIDLGRANNIGQFSAHLSEVAYNFNLLYADRAGNIAYWQIGQVPIRAEGTNPFFPLPGTGEVEWQGILPFDQMPHSRNPEQGFLTSWNNKPSPGWENSSTNFWMWGGAHRVNTLNDQLSRIEPGTATVQTLEEINRIAGWTTDTPTGTADAVFVSSYLDSLLAAVATSADDRLPEVVAALQGWNQMQVDADGNGFYDDPSGTIFNAWWFALSSGVFDEVADLTDVFTLGNLVDRLLRGEEAALPLQYDYLSGATVEEAVTSSLIAALDQLSVEYGSADPADWLQPISTIGWDPIGAVGVPDTIWMNRGTYNQIVRLGGRVWAENVIAPGQSGDPTSPHFADQLPLYASWTYKEMRLTKADLSGHTESVMELEVP